MLTNTPLHRAEGDAPSREGYRYSAAGIGVRADLVQAVLDAWAGISVTGDPAAPLRSVGDGAINSVDNLARIAAQAVAEGTAAGEPQRDAVAELRAQLVQLHAFVKARAAETVAAPLFWESIGYALGEGEAHLAQGDTVRAAEQIAWFRTEAARWQDHPDYPTTGDER